MSEPQLFPPAGPRVALDPESWYDYYPGWLNETDATALQVHLTAALPWEHRSIFVFGREVPQPRLIAWAGDQPYRYSGQTLPERAWTERLRALNAQVEATAGHTFNHVLVNRYRDGHDRMGKHADDEPELGLCPLIASISLGARRRFVFHPKNPRGRKRVVWLEHGSLLIMGGTCQHRWYHSLPGATQLQEERINLTFRLLHGPPGWRPAGAP